MPIRKYLADDGFEPDVITLMSDALEAACSALGAAAQTAEQKELIASRIIAAAQSGERDVEVLRDKGMSVQSK